MYNHATTHNNQHEHSKRRPTVVENTDLLSKNVII